MSAKETGALAELKAREYLESLGYRYLASNYRTPYGEIDLVFQEGSVLVLAEVKFRRHNPHFPALEAIDRPKIKRILKSAEIYMDRQSPEVTEMRVDAIFVEKAPEGYLIRHMKGFQ